MKKSFAIIMTMILAFVLKAQAQQPGSQQLPMMHMSGLLALAETIPLPGDGYMDHLAVDVKGQRIFISGEAANQTRIPRRHVARPPTHVQLRRLYENVVHVSRRELRDRRG